MFGIVEFSAFLDDLNRRQRHRSGSPYTKRSQIDARETVTISDATIQQVVGTLRSFGAKRILLFGSFVRDPTNAKDLDVAVEGIPLSRVWEADAELSEILNMPCDLVVREENPAFYEIIRKRATVLYEQAGVD
ncbi:MAG: hypothetical protein HY706_21545 [Candidatus Hydrogenedentes bacterium]|nr:hypothetical protein [Candidatus Hydrogenedentota bacterium]